MNATDLLGLKTGMEVYTLSDFSIEKFFIEDIVLPKLDSEKSIKNFDLCDYVDLKLEMYNNRVDSFKIKRKLKDCYLTVEELISNLQPKYNKSFTIESNDKPKPKEIIHKDIPLVKEYLKKHFGMYVLDEQAEKLLIFTYNIHENGIKNIDVVSETIE